MPRVYHSARGAISQRRRADPAPVQAHRRVDRREAADRAVRDANLEIRDIDAVVVGKAPDLFEGVMMPELYLADALGAVGKPLLRVHTAGSVGGAAGIVAASLVQAGVHRKVLAVAFEKQSESSPMWRCRSRRRSASRWWPARAGTSRRTSRAYIRRSGAPDHIGAMVAVKDRRNGALNPYAHLQQADITLESVQASRCCGARSGTTRPAPPRTAPAR